MTLVQAPALRAVGSFCALAASNLHKNDQAVFRNPNRF